MTQLNCCTGILLHLTSLPGPNPYTGTLGKSANRFVDKLAESRCTLWQMLPVGPVFGHRSPYESPSSIAGNPDFLDLQECVDQYGLPPSFLTTAFQQQGSLQRVRQKASHCFWAMLRQDAVLEQRMAQFLRSNAYWLYDFALFSALKAHFKGAPWWLWPKPLKDKNTDALKTFEAENQASIQQVYFEQYLFSQQWQRLKTYAENCGVHLVGDIPIYVAHDSADVWGSKELFTLDREGLCTEVAGVPPDYFSADGQRWGSPLYLWENHESDGFSWWKQRIAVQAERFHSLRIDHFRGLESYWAIPVEQPDGKVGQWRSAPGDALLECLTEAFPDVQFIAEDLGMITPEVYQLRDKFDLPGMKILQFAFDGSPDNPYLPHNIEENSVVYTGTHDNNTVLGWINECIETGQEDGLNRAMTLLGCERHELLWAMIRAVIKSKGLWSIIPLQDVFELDQTARMNIPGTIDNNWSWRFDEKNYMHTGWNKLKQCIEEEECFYES